jgi:hypothetical protein
MKGLSLKASLSFVFFNVVLNFYVAIARSQLNLLFLIDNPAYDAETNIRISTFVKKFAQVFQSQHHGSAVSIVSFENHVIHKDSEKPVFCSSLSFVNNTNVVVNNELVFSDRNISLSDKTYILEGIRKTLTSNEFRVPHRRVKQLILVISNDFASSQPSKALFKHCGIKSYEPMGEVWKKFCIGKCFLEYILLPTAPERSINMKLSSAIVFKKLSGKLDSITAARTVEDLEKVVESTVNKRVEDKRLLNNGGRRLNENEELVTRLINHLKSMELTKKHLKKN